MSLVFFAADDILIQAAKARVQYMWGQRGEHLSHSPGKAFMVLGSLQVLPLLWALPSALLTDEP